jgi:hypothetical protein
MHSAGDYNISVVTGLVDLLSAPCKMIPNYEPLFLFSPAIFSH